MGNIIWGIIVVLVALWLIGLVTNIVGNLIHLLIVGAIIFVIYNLLTSRRNRA